MEPTLNWMLAMMHRNQCGVITLRLEYHDQPGRVRLAILVVGAACRKVLPVVRDHLAIHLDQDSQAVVHAQGTTSLREVFQSLERAGMPFGYFPVPQPLGMLVLLTPALVTPAFESRLQAVGVPSQPPEGLQ